MTTCALNLRSPWDGTLQPRLCTTLLHRQPRSFVLTIGASPIDWIIAALLSSLGFAVVSITDKVIMSGMGLRVRGFLLFIGFQVLAMAVVIAVLNPFPDSIEAAVYAKGLAVGLLWGVGAPLILWTLSREEVSRIAPIFQSYPLLVVLFAVVLLGESLSGLESLVETFKSAEFDDLDSLFDVVGQQSFFC